MKITKLKIADLSADPANVRKHDDRNIETIMGSLRRFGQQKPIVVDKSKVVRAGNGTLEAAKRIGWETIEAYVSDLTGSEMTAYAIADNRTAELAEWDEAALAAVLEGLQQDGMMEFSGFNDNDLCDLLSGIDLENEDATTEDDVPDVKPDSISKPGDVWLLDEHRVLCGDSRDMLALDRLLDGALCDMCFTDPPYNVGYIGKTKDALQIKNDEMSGDDFLQFLRDVFSSINVALKPGSLVYVCHADSEGMRFRRAFEDPGLLFKQCLIWVKNCLVLGLQDYHWRHEPILYGWKPGESHRFYADRKQTTVIEGSEGISFDHTDDGIDVTVIANGRTIIIKVPEYKVILDGTDELESTWLVDKPTRSADHPTMKPVRLCARAIKHGTKRGEIVLDSFLGSGSTLIAAEQLGRTCYGMEIDPQYCDVIVKRWENLTGKNATRQSATPD